MAHYKLIEVRQGPIYEQNMLHKWGLSLKNEKKKQKAQK